MRDWQNSNEDAAIYNRRKPANSAGVNLLAGLEIFIGVLALGYGIWSLLNISDGSAETQAIERAGGFAFVVLGLAFAGAGWLLRLPSAIKWAGQLLWVIPIFLVWRHAAGA